MLKGYTVVDKSTLSDFIEDSDDIDSAWEKEWKGMPEFVQEQVEPYSKIIIRFESHDDLLEFGKLIGQHLTNKTKSIWHPKIPRGLNANMRYTT